jgi:hypothetical protein
LVPEQGQKSGLRATWSCSVISFFFAAPRRQGRYSTRACVDERSRFPLPTALHRIRSGDSRGAASEPDLQPHAHLLAQSTCRFAASYIGADPRPACSRPSTLASVSEGCQSCGKSKHSDSTDWPLRSVPIALRGYATLCTPTLTVRIGIEAVDSRASFSRALSRVLLLAATWLASGYQCLGLQDQNVWRCGALRLTITAFDFVRFRSIQAGPALPPRTHILQVDIGTRLTSANENCSSKNRVTRGSKTWLGAAAQNTLLSAENWSNTLQHPRSSFRLASELSELLRRTEIADFECPSAYLGRRTWFPK